MSKQVKIIAVSGGSGSGKTTFARRLHERFPETSTILYQDSYYIDQSHKFDHDGGSVNFDHPDSLDFDFMAKHLVSLKSGNSIEAPIYDFATHTRQAKTQHYEPHELVLVDGILLLSQAKLLPLFDYRIFIDCKEELRFERRLKRDTIERGRTPEGVRQQFEKQVKPMHDQFVGPSKVHADLVVTQERFDTELNSLIEKIVSNQL